MRELSDKVCQELTEKIDQAIEVIELLKLQRVELEEQNQALIKEVNLHKKRQQDWENSLLTLLKKLESADLSFAEKEKLKAVVEQEELVF